MPTVQWWVKKAAEIVAEETNDEQWLGVESRPTALVGDYHLLEREVDVRTMMLIGGCSDYSTIELHLTEQTENRIGKSMNVWYFQPEFIRSKGQPSSF